MKPISIDYTVAKTLVEVMGSCRKSVEVSHENAKLVISKAGRCNKDLLEYKPIAVEDGKLAFYWDDLIYDLPEGRYKAQLHVDDSCCSAFQIEIGQPCGILNVENIDRIEDIDCGS